MHGAADIGNIKGKPSGPPELEAELIEAPAVGAKSDGETPKATANEPHPPSRRRSSVKIWAIVAGGMIIAGAGFYLVRTVLDRLLPASDANVAGEDGRASPADEEILESSNAGSSAPGPSKISTAAKAAVAPGASPMAVEDRGLPPPLDEGDALSDEAFGKSAVVATGSLQADAAPMMGPANPQKPLVSSAVAPTAERQDEPTAGDGTGDVFADLEAQAEALAAAEAQGAAPPDPGAVGNSSENSPVAAAGIAAGMSAEVDELRSLFETETARLSSALMAEKARADAQALEIAALQENMRREATPHAAGSLPNDGAQGSPPSRMSQSDIAGRATLALIALMRAVDQGEPFKSELARVEALALGAPAIEELRALAADGAPTLAALKYRFPAEAREALAADIRSRASGPLSGLTAGIARLISVRPAKPTPGARPAAVLSRVEAALAADDVRGAINEFGTLQGAARDSLSRYIADAERHVAARSAVASLYALFVDRSQPGAPL